MLPAPQDNGGGTSNSRAAKTDGIPYLKAEHLTRENKEAQILAVKADPNNRFGAAVVVKLKLEEKTFFWTVRLNNPNYDKLLREFGTDESGWKDQTVLLRNEMDSFSENYYPTVSFQR